MSYDNSNSGVLFRNEKKEKGDKLPDYRGNCEVNGVKMDVAGWIKESTKKPGRKFIALKFSTPWVKKLKESVEAPAPQKDNDVPF